MLQNVLPVSGYAQNCWAKIAVGAVVRRAVLKKMHLRRIVSSVDWALIDEYGTDQVDVSKEEDNFWTVEQSSPLCRLYISCLHMCEYLLSRPVNPDSEPKFMLELHIVEIVSGLCYTAHLSKSREVITQHVFLRPTNANKHHRTLLPSFNLRPQRRGSKGILL